MRFHAAGTPHRVLGIGFHGVVAYIHESGDRGNTGTESSHDSPSTRSRAAHEWWPLAYHSHVPLEVDVDHEKYSVLETEL